MSTQEARAGHFLWYGQPKESEDGGGNVAEKAGDGDARADFLEVGFLEVVDAADDEGYGRDGVFFERVAGFGVPFHFGVAVVGGDKQAALPSSDGAPDLVETSINSGDGFSGGLVVAGVADHVAVGEIEDDKLVAGLDAVDDGVGDGLGRHFRVGLELFGFEGGDEEELFAGAFGFAAAVKKVSNVGVFFGLGDVDLGDARFGEDVGEGVGKFGQGKGDGNRQASFVLGHGDDLDLWVILAGEVGEIWQGEGFGDLAGAGLAGVGKDQGVACL